MMNHFLPSKCYSNKTFNPIILTSLLITAPLITAPLLANAESKAKEHTAELKSEIDRVSYSIGYVHGQRLKNDIEDLNSDIFISGFKASFDNSKPFKPLMNETEIQDTLKIYQQKRQEAMIKEREVEATANKKAGDAYLQENKTKKDVQTTDSGLQYKILKQGKGKGRKPTLSDEVKVHYHGTLIDGTVFDSSIERGQPASFPINGVIAGWTEALQLMSEGSEWMLYIPAELAYGERSPSAKIGANSTLIFKVELLEILSK